MPRLYRLITNDLALCRGISCLSFVAGLRRRGSPRFQRSCVSASAWPVTVASDVVEEL